MEQPERLAAEVENLEKMVISYQRGLLNKPSLTAE